MPTDLPDLVQRYKKRGLIVDANLLVVVVLGLIQVRLLKEHPKTKDYSADDFEYLNQFIGLFDKCITTPHILTEVSNLVTSKNLGSHKDAFAKVWQALTDYYLEVYVPAKQFVNEWYFPHFGLTDAGILTLLDEQDLLFVSNDRPLIDLTRSRGKSCILYDDLR